MSPIWSNREGQAQEASKPVWERWPLQDTAHAAGREIPTNLTTGAASSARLKTFEEHAYTKHMSSIVSLSVGPWEGREPSSFTGEENEGWVADVLPVWSRSG